VDLHTLVSHGIDKLNGFGRGEAIDRSFDPAMSIRALQFYGDGTLPAFASRRGLSPGGLGR